LKILLVAKVIARKYEPTFLSDLSVVVVLCWENKIIKLPNPASRLARFGAARQRNPKIKGLTYIFVQSPWGLQALA